jgi:hypothetical protein
MRGQTRLTPHFMPRNNINIKSSVRDSDGSNLATKLPGLPGREIE